MVKGRLKPEKHGKLYGFLEILRPLNCLMMGFATLLGAIITVGFRVNPFLVFLGFVTAFTLTGSSMALNDYFDRFVDLVNEPTRPIPRGTIKPREALGFAFFLAFLGLFSASITSLTVKSLGFLVLVVAFLAYGLSAYYNVKGKKYGFLGNLMVSGCVAVPFLYGAFMVGFFPKPVLLVFAFLAFLSNTGREIIKGIADVEGDKLRNVQTLAIKLNPKKASYVASVFYVLAVCLSFLPPMFGMVSLWYIPFVVVACAGFLFTAFYTVKNPSAKNAKKMKKLSLLWMGFGLTAFLVGSIM